jgi:hypothetical protein
VQTVERREHRSLVPERHGISICIILARTRRT